MAISADDVTIIAPTPIEAKAARRYCSSLDVVESGVALANLREMPKVAAISFGLAGGVRRDLEPGTLLIPDEIGAADGRRVACDAELASMLRSAATRLGYTAVRDPIFTANTVITGAERAQLAAQGFAGVDMESALLRSPRVAVARAILDTPEHELSPEWMNPARAMLNPMNWPQAFRLARESPRCAGLAARVIAAAFA
jgi:4-hydroxy-3-methylbut-2-en-1-yl diphosphate reductase